MTKPAAKAAKAPAKAKRAKPVEKPRTTASRGATAPEKVEASGLTPKQAAFVAEYTIDLNGTQAALRAGYSERAARAIATENLAKPAVRAAIDAALAARQASVGIESDAVLSRMWALSTADARELTEYHVDCCRHCWGIGFLRQRTPEEMRRARAEHIRQTLIAQAKGLAAPSFDEEGGEGYNRNREPNPECPECFGRGEGRAIFKDTRNLSPGAAMLFAGVKQTKDGIEVKTHSPPDALLQVGRHLGMFAEKLILAGKVKHTHDATSELREFLMNRESRLPIAGANTKE